MICAAIALWLLAGMAAIIALAWRARNKPARVRDSELPSTRPPGAQPEPEPEWAPWHNTMPTLPPPIEKERP